jgi:hypothetical protein
MTADGWITVAILGVMFGLLIGTKLPPAVVFAGALTIALTFDLASAAFMFPIAMAMAMAMAAAMGLDGMPFAITVMLTPLFFPF